MWKSQSTFKKTKQKKKTNKSLKHSGLWLMDRRLTCPRLMKWGKKKELLMVQSISSAKYYCMRTSLLVPMIWLPTAQLLLLFFLLFFLFYFLHLITYMNNRFWYDHMSQVYFHFQFQGILHVFSTCDHILLTIKWEKETEVIFLYEFMTHEFMS